jgi:hypothetical protein
LTLVGERKHGDHGRVEIGRPETEREIEVLPLEEPVPLPAPEHEPAVAPDVAPA